MNMTHYLLAQLSLLGVLLGAVPAYGQRICILDFPGAGGATVRRQLAGQLCDAADCVAPPQVTTRRKPDAKKAKRKNVQYFVAGAKRGRALSLSVLSVARNNALAAKRSFPLDRGRLSARNLRSAASFLQGAMEEAAPAPASAPVAEPSPPPDAPEEESAQAWPPPAPVDAEPASPQEPSDEPPSVSSPGARARRGPALAVDLGSDVLNRHFGYNDATSGNLRQYDLALFPLPSIRAELYPFALAGFDALASLGLEGSFAYAPFLKSRRTSGTDAYPTTAMKVDAGLRWRILPFDNYAMAITPYAGLRIQTFTLGASSAGELLDGLPNLQFVSLRAGVGLEVPVAQDAVILLARLGVLPLLSAGELIPAYFAKGSGFGFEGSAGLAVQLMSALQIRATFEYTQYTLSFQSSSTDLYVASGAVDRYLGGNIALRLQL